MDNVNNDFYYVKRISNHLMNYILLMKKLQLDIKKMKSQTQMTCLNIIQKTKLINMAF